MEIPFVDLKPQYEDLKVEINKNIQNVLNHGMFVLGPEVKECEEKLATFTGVKHAVTCSNGTVALSLALMAIGIKPGDEIITTSFSFIATAEVIVSAGATPVFVDVDPVTYNINTENIEAAITKKTKAIMPVSLYGLTADMDEINRIAEKYDLKVIEDGAQSFGATYKGKYSGNLSLLGTTSFFPAKPLGCYGDGGAVFTNDDELAETIKQLRHHGQTERYYHPIVGMNGRMNTLQCAILIPKIKRYEKEIKMRQAVANRYSEALNNYESKEFILPKIPLDRTSVWAQYTIKSHNRESVIAKLKEKGVPTAIHYPKTMADQPAYRDVSKIHDISVSQELANNVFSLPMYADMPEEVQNKIIESVISIL
ncbi:MAG: DegT/DnrJ/EryC1/StrS family aminotransferase [Bdellovibrionales bacterium]|nr:DegT/DnrJ/EryC1/StrS family aminotransferase [Bdellovibrionales bacterium]